MPDYFFKIGVKNIVIPKLKAFFAALPSLNYKNNRTDVFDAPLQAVVAEYQKINRLKTQDGYLNAETYAQIGQQLSDVQVDQITLHAPDLKKLLYGVGLIDVCGEWNDVAPVIPKEKFIGWGYNYPQIPLVCFRYCWEQLKATGHDLKSPGWGAPSKINPDIYQIKLTENAGGLKKGELAQQFTAGVLYLKKALKSKTPVVVGIDDAPDTRINPKTKKEEVHHDNPDHITDHFVTIVGMGSDTGGKYFLFFDNSTKYPEIGTSAENKLYCDCLNFTISGKPDPKNSYGQGGYGVYTVTQIRESK